MAAARIVATAIVLALLLGAAAAGSAAAAADDNGDPDCRPGQPGWFCVPWQHEGSDSSGGTPDGGVDPGGDSTGGDSTGGDGTAGDGTGGQQDATVELPPLTYRASPGQEPDGSTCVEFIAQWVENPSTFAFSPEEAAEARRVLATGQPYTDPDYTGHPDVYTGHPEFGTLHFPLCSYDGRAFDARGAAAVLWTGLQVASPAAKIAPGYMLVGLTAYLQLDVPAELVVSRELPHGFGTLTITATPQHHIDWDDDAVGPTEDGGKATTGEPDGGPVSSGATVTSASGQPYPGGPEEITHVYTTAGQRFVSVTTHWEGSLHAPDIENEPLGVREADTVVVPLEVRQWQAVRTTR